VTATGQNLIHSNLIRYVDIKRRIKGTDRSFYELIPIDSKSLSDATLNTYDNDNSYYYE